MRKKKIVKREQVSKGYTLELEEMTKSDKKKYSFVKWSLLHKSICFQSWRKKRFSKIPL